MDVTIRDTLEADLPELFRIRTDPLVRPNQHKLKPSDTIELWSQQLFGPHEAGEMVFKCTTIMHEDQVVGHVSRFHWEADGMKGCYCGWNIAPSHWGKGVAPMALSQLFDSFFSTQSVDVVIADCFSSNQRCIRVMKKLNFLRGNIGVLERVHSLFVNRSFKWLLRFYLFSDQCRGKLGELETRIAN